MVRVLGFRVWRSGLMGLTQGGLKSIVEEGSVSSVGIMGYGGYPPHTYLGLFGLGL